MKITEIYQQDYAVDAGKRLPPELLTIAFEALKDRKTSVDIEDIAREILEQGYTRTVGSARFTLNRMHILIHGVAPYGVTEKAAEKMFRPPQTMQDFVEGKGINVNENLMNAKEEIKNRPKKVRRKEATKMFSAYYFENKDFIDRAKFTGMNQANRERVIKMIMSGITPEEAFAQF